MVDASSIGLLVAFGAGVFSFLSPCVLPLVPAYMSYIAGDSAQRERRSSLGQRQPGPSISSVRANARDSSLSTRSQP